MVFYCPPHAVSESVFKHELGKFEVLRRERLKLGMGMKHAIPSARLSHGDLSLHLWRGGDGQGQIL